MLCGVNVFCLQWSMTRISKIKRKCYYSFDIQTRHYSQDLSLLKFEQFRGLFKIVVNDVYLIVFKCNYFDSLMKSRFSVIRLPSFVKTPMYLFILIFASVKSVLLRLILSRSINHGSFTSLCI